MDKAKYVTLALVAVVLSTSLMIPSVDAEESDYTEGRFFYNQLTAQEKRYYNDLSNASVGKKITCYDLDSFQKALYAYQSEVSCSIFNAGAGWEAVWYNDGREYVEIVSRSGDNVASNVEELKVAI
ncbi:MAG: hypothetical protein IJ026_01440, partial [Candidatus Methanomethylophilaceae archaeon]|nr:hypothetical protein [Candidatus Methanomethylophilaceae archaeon]